MKSKWAARTAGPLRVWATQMTTNPEMFCQMTLGHKSGTDRSNPVKMLFLTVCPS